MTKFIIVLVSIILLLGCKKSSIREGKDEFIDVRLNELWNQDSIDYYRNFLLTKKIDFKVSEVKFNDEKLIYAKVSVNCNDGFAGSADASIKGDCQLGFVRNYNKKAEVQFLVGCLNKL